MKSVAQPLRRVKAKVAAAIGCVGSMLRPHGCRGKPKASECHPTKMMPSMLALPPCRCGGSGNWSPSCHMHHMPVYAKPSSTSS